MGSFPAMVHHISVCRVVEAGDVYADLCRTNCRKFFTIVVVLNGVGLLLAILNIWKYPRRYTGAFILGNLIFALLMRNEVFGRCLYWFFNTCFGKVSEGSALGST